MLLEKSSPLDSGDDHYRQILPRELADLRLSLETRNEIIATLCAEVSRNPDDAFIGAICFTGADEATRTVAKILTDPPRSLTMGEYASALSLVTKFLPYCLAEDAEFLPRTDLERLVRVVNELQNVEGGETNEDRSAQITISHLAPQLLRSLKQFDPS
jgi:hypothetical protein